MATAKEVLEELRTLGKESFQKTYRRHGATGEVYGVSTAHLKNLQKKLKNDSAIAAELWKSGVYDARILTTMIGDPDSIEPATFERWVKDLDNYPLTDAFAGFVSRSPHARSLAEAWESSKNEWIRSAAWHILARLAIDDPALPDSYFEPRLDFIEKNIDKAQNRVRHEMNGALIAIGIRSEKLEKKALAAAKRIGTIEVDHGQTSCVTPDAQEYIARVKARRRERS